MKLTVFLVSVIHAAAAAKKKEAAEADAHVAHHEHNPLALIGLPNLEPFFEVGLALINYIAGGILLVSCLIALMNVGVLYVNTALGTKKNQFQSAGAMASVGIAPAPPTLQSVRFSLCSMILVALNFLVAVDIIETLIKPAHVYQMEDLFKLALIAGVRTILAYFLAKETEELEHELMKHSNAKGHDAAKKHD